MRNFRMAGSELEVNERLYLTGKVEDGGYHHRIQRQAGSAGAKDSDAVNLKHMLAFALQPLDNDQTTAPQQHRRHLHRQAMRTEQ